MAWKWVQVLCVPGEQVVRPGHALVGRLEEERETCDAAGDERVAGAVLPARAVERPDCQAVQPGVAAKEEAQAPGVPAQRRPQRRDNVAPARVRSPPPASKKRNELTAESSALASASADAWIRSWFHPTRCRSQRALPLTLYPARGTYGLRRMAGSRSSAEMAARTPYASANARTAVRSAVRTTGAARTGAAGGSGVGSTIVGPCFSCCLSLPL